MKIAVLFADKNIIIDDKVVNDPELVPEDPNYRVIRWNDEGDNGEDMPPGNGVIEVRKGERIWLSKPDYVQKYIARHAELWPVVEAKLQQQEELLQAHIEAEEAHAAQVAAGEENGAEGENLVDAPTESGVETPATDEQPIHE